LKTYRTIDPMGKNFKPGQRVKMRLGTQDEYTYGRVIIQDEEYTIVQFEDLEHPTSFTQAGVEQLELCENEAQ